MNMNKTTFYGYGLDEKGEPIKRTPHSHPYNYDGFVLWGFVQPQNAHTSYSDRLWQENPEKHDELCMKYFGDVGQYWADRDVDNIQSFLSDFIGEPVELLRIMQYCNQSSGYPYWRFEWKKLSEMKEMEKENE